MTWECRYSIDWIRAVRLGADHLLTGTELNLAAFEMSTAPMILPRVARAGLGRFQRSGLRHASARTDDMVFFLISLNKLVCSRVAVVVPA